MPWLATQIGTSGATTHAATVRFGVLDSAFEPRTKMWRTVHDVKQRRLLTLLAAATAAGLTGCTDAAAGVVWRPPPSARIPMPGGGTPSLLLGEYDLLALTADDGVDTEVMRDKTSSPLTPVSDLPTR